MLHKLAVITALYENYTILTDFFSSFEKQTDTDFDIFITDSSSKRQKVKLPPFAHLIPSENKGYAHAVNQGIAKAKERGFDQYIVINSDTYVKENFIAKVKSALTTHPNSIIGGKIYYAPGYEYHKDRYEKEDLGKIIWYAGGHIDWNHALAIHENVDQKDKEKSIVKRTDFITGCLMCYDSLVLEKIGEWDESYFLYFEDADFCERAKRKGIILYYDSEIVIWHKNAQSTGGSGSSLHDKYQQNNRLTFGNRYAPFRTKLHLWKNHLLRR